MLQVFFFLGEQIKYKFVRSFTIFWAVGVLFLGFLQIILFTCSKPHHQTFILFVHPSSKLPLLAPFVVAHICVHSHLRCQLLLSLVTYTYVLCLSAQVVPTFSFFYCAHLQTQKKKASKQYGPGDTCGCVACVPKLRAYLSAIPPNCNRGHLIPSHCRFLHAPAYDKPLSLIASIGIQSSRYPIPRVFFITDRLLEAARFRSMRKPVDVRH